MKSIVLIKKVNNTELGKGNTNDTYLLIPNDLDIADFLEHNISTDFIYGTTGETVKLRFTIGREQRIVGFGPFYRKTDLQAGDEVVLKKTWDDSVCEYSISIRKYNSVVLIQKFGAGYEILNDNRKRLLESEILKTIDGKDIAVKFIYKKKKRKDSPNETACYQVFVDGQDISGLYPNKGLLELEVVDGVVHITKPILWRKYILEWEDDHE